MKEHPNLIQRFFISVMVSPISAVFNRGLNYGQFKKTLVNENASNILSLIRSVVAL